MPGVLAYLILDAMILGLMATALCMSFFPSGLIRVALLTVLFPLFSLGLCAWMTVFGFYLRLEDLVRRAHKRKLAKEALIAGKRPPSNQFINLAFEPTECETQK